MNRGELEARESAFVAGILCWMFAAISVGYSIVAEVRWPVVFALFVSAFGLVLVAAATLGYPDE